MPPVVVDRRIQRMDRLGKRIQSNLLGKKISELAGDGLSLQRIKKEPLSNVTLIVE